MLRSVSAEAIFGPVFRCLSHPVQVKPQFVHDHCADLYDFSDDWKHSIVLEKILTSTDESPRCLAGKRNCPWEDCGGPHQYMEVLAVRKDPKHPRRKEMSERLAWFDPEFNPERFNLKELNARLAT